MEISDAYIQAPATWNAAAVLGYIGNYQGNAAGLWHNFASVAVPQGTTIIAAALKIRAGGQDGAAGTVLAKSAVEIADDSSMPGSFAGQAARVLSSGVAWTAPTSGSIGDLIEVDVTADVQTIVNRAGWVSGNAISFRTYDNGSAADVRIGSNLLGSGDVQTELAITIAGVARAKARAVKIGPAVLAEVRIGRRRR